MYWRLIPARAGNISIGGCRGWPHAAHPRSRGEHRKGEREPCPVCGSSPLARGTYAVTGTGLSTVRLIPARAGNIRGGSGSGSSTPAHPRSRGEHRFSRSRITAGCGSSPLARGTSLPTPFANRYRRLIPARAGNMSRGSRGREPCPAHPRSRGEHNRRAGRQQAARGSSPLARGT